MAFQRLTPSWSVRLAASFTAGSSSRTSGTTWFLPRGRIVGGAPSCPGQLPKGVLMDAQTVIAVCELLLVVVALIDLVGRRDE